MSLTLLFLVDGLISGLCSDRGEKAANLFLDNSYGDTLDIWCDSVFCFEGA